MMSAAFTPPLKPPPRATAAPPSSPTQPPTPQSTPEPPRPSQSRPKHYRCSKCGQIGHNIRGCPTPQVWFRQRCSLCGGTGHNARNCPKTTTCRVCNGLGRLACSQCAGKGFHAPPAEKHALSDSQKITAERIRQRVRRVVGTVGEDGLVLVGSDTAAKRCKRCLGRGFLSCMACCDDE